MRAMKEAAVQQPRSERSDGEGSSTVDTIAQTVQSSVTNEEPIRVSVEVPTCSDSIHMALQGGEEHEVAVEPCHGCDSSFGGGDDSFGDCNSSVIDGSSSFSGGDGDNSGGDCDGSFVDGNCSFSGQDSSLSESRNEDNLLQVSPSGDNSHDLSMDVLSDLVSLDDSSSSSSSRPQEQTLMQSYIDEWLTTLAKEDFQALSLLLHVALTEHAGLNQTTAAVVAGNLLHYSDRTIREWKVQFMANGGRFLDTRQGSYKRTGVLWSSEELNAKARAFVRKNASVKGKTNMTAASFCSWINNDFLPYEALRPGYPRRVSVELARRWLHQLGFTIINKSKGIFIDGHERADVVEYRKTFLRRMAAIGFVNEDNAPTPEAAAALPNDITSPPEEQREKTIVIFHDESIFNANEDQSTMWGTEDQHFVRPKSKGAGIMISDFVDERNGFLQLTDAEYEEAQKTTPTIKKEARVYLEYGEGKEGYWTSARFMTQMKDAVAIAEFKYPRAKGYRLHWIFDQSSCHTAFAEETLNAFRMNAKPGGHQPKMRDTIYNGKLQRMTFPDGTQKGLIAVLQERGVNVREMKIDEMKATLSSFSDFKTEKTVIEHYLHGCGHGCLFLPKFHCELNPIERCWGQAKRYTRALCNYTLPGLRKTIPKGFQSITMENIQNFFTKSRNYMFAYMEGLEAGTALELQMKEYKSHRRVGVND